MKTTRIRALIAASGGGGTISSITGLQAALDGKAALSRTQAISTVTGLQTALDGKQASGSYASATHTHAQSDVTNLVSDLAGKAASTHSHAISDTTGLQAALDGKLATSAASGWARLSVGTSAPVGPSTGDLWVDTN